MTGELRKVKQFYTSLNSLYSSSGMIFSIEYRARTRRDPGSIPFNGTWELSWNHSSVACPFCNRLNWQRINTSGKKHYSVNLPPAKYIKLFISNKITIFITCHLASPRVLIIAIKIFAINKLAGSLFTGLEYSCEVETQSSLWVMHKHAFKNATQILILFPL